MRSAPLHTLCEPKRPGISGVPRRLMVLIALLLGLASAVYFCLGLTTYSACDGLYRWQESAYVLRGIDPFLVASGQVAPLADIGPLNPDGGNMPWTYLLSNCIYPGFLSYDWALVFARILFAALLIVTVFRMTRYLRQTYAATRLETLLLLGVLFCSYMWFATLRLGNHAAYITLFTFLLLTFDHNKHWVAAGILYALLLIKPQDSGLFLLFFLLKRQYKPLLLCGGILLSVTVLTGILIGCAPWSMLTNVYELCVSYQNLDNYIYYGLLDPLVSLLHIDSAIVLPVSVALGIASVIFVALRCKKCDQETLFGFIALVSMCWMYVQPSDMILLGLTSFTCATALLYKYGVGPLFYPLALGALLTALPIPGIAYMTNFVVPLFMRGLLITVTVSLLRAMERGSVQPAASQDGAPAN